MSTRSFFFFFLGEECEFIFSETFKHCFDSIALYFVTTLVVTTYVILRSTKMKTIKQSVIDDLLLTMFNNTTTSHHPHLQTLDIANATVEWRRSRSAKLLELT